MTTYPKLMNVGVADQTPRIAIPAALGDTVLRQAIESARDGITISDVRLPDMPLVYVNPAFTRMSGYQPDEILGINCRFLQGDDTIHPGIDKIRRAIGRGSSCIVTLRNYKRDGTLFHNELSLSPVRDRDGVLTHYVGIQKDVTRRVKAERRLMDRDRELQRLNVQLEQMARCDSLTNLLNRRTFDDCLDREWRRCLREGGLLSIYMVDVDHFKQINDRYGHALGDVCLRRIADVLEDCFGRAVDFVARYGGEEFVILNHGLSAEEAVARGEHLLSTVRTMKLPSPISKLTVSVGLATVEPNASITTDSVLKAADSALYRAKGAGRDRLAVAPAS